MRHLLSENRHAAHHKRNIGRRRDTPAMRGTIRSMRTQGQVNQRGEKHTARRGNNRQTRRLRVPEFAVGHLALDFEPDIEEENRHHRVVDEPVQVRRPHPAPNRHREGQVPKMMVTFRSKVRPQEGRNRHDDQDDTAGRLHLHQAFHRRNNLADGCFREQIFYLVAARNFCGHSHLSLGLSDSALRLTK